VTLAYFGLTGATFAPLQNVIPRMIENAASPSAKAIDLGVVTGLGALAAVVANPAAGHVSDRRAGIDNRTGMVLAGIVSGALFLFLLGRHNSLAGITVFWVLSQIAVNAVYASLPASIVDHVPPDNWGSVWGLVGTAQALGLVAGFAIVGVIFTGISTGMTALVVLRRDARAVYRDRRAPAESSRAAGGNRYRIPRRVGEEFRIPVGMAGQVPGDPG